MEKKTAMEELIEWIELRRKQLAELGEDTLAYQYALMETQAKSLLPKEREQIEEAIVVCLEEYGCNIPLPEDAQKEIASEYFTQKYGHGKD